MYPNGADFALSLTFDVEMCTNFPYWTSQWNHRKGAIDEDSKLYMGKMLDVAEKYGVKLVLPGGQRFRRPKHRLSQAHGGGRPRGGQPHVPPREREGEGHSAVAACTPTRRGGPPA